ncbi:hypothetical protein CHS0354_040949 [Potamilus streckersoni]|uniref:G-protein coupled receptors family 1 profile domain-containing protein n=1 Tax=Potamilus streckersoni TaxID=2493646 RepID=A0AAE0T7N1_9BIVA|nr:hypothetical protein CHS0354_040949 [Potamilus streckersoni]
MSYKFQFKGSNEHDSGLEKLGYFSNLHNRQGLIVSLILTALVILLTTPTVVFNWDVVNHDCTVLPGQEIIQTIFYGTLAAIFFVLFITSLVSYALVLILLYKSKRRLSMIQKSSSRPRWIKCWPKRRGKVGVAVTESSSTLREGMGETSNSMNTKMFILSNISDKDTSVPLHSVEASAIMSIKISKGTGQQDIQPGISSSNFTNFRKQNKCICRVKVKLENNGKNSSSKASNSLNKPNSSMRNGMKKTTFIIFLTTLVYILSWLPPIILAFIWNSVEHEYLNSRIMTYAVLFMRKSHFINNFTNPILYIALHSELRQRTKILLCGSQ